MGLRLRSLSEDGVDTYTHVWSVALFLVLSFLLLVVPDKQSQIQDQDEPATPSVPEYQAKCWCPAQFEDSQVIYTNQVCSKIFNSGIKKQGYVLSASQSDWTPDVSYKKIRVKKEPSTKKNDLVIRNSKIREFGPLILFILAVTLRLPKILCSMVSRLCNCVNIEHTLESAEKGETAGHEVRHQTFSTLVKGFQDFTRKSGNTTTYMYICMKILIIVVLVSQIVFVSAIVVPQLQATLTTHEEANTLDTKTVSPLPSPFSFNNSFTSPVQAPRKLNDEEEMFEESPIFHCYFRIRQMENEHEYAVQCILKRRLLFESKQFQTEVSDSSMTFIVFVIALANLIILTAVHKINTLLWFLNLALDSTKTRLGLKKDSTLDLVLLIQMARSNLGVGVAAGLVEAVSDDQQPTGDDKGHCLLDKI